MKIIILLMFAFGCLGFICEWTYRVLIESKETLKEKFNKLKLLFMIPVYAVSCVLIGLLYKIPLFRDIKYLPLLMLMGCLIATIFEFGSGLLLNKVLKFDIWDYSGSKIKIFGKDIPLHIMGQIDLFHEFLWCVLTIFVVYVSEIITWLVN